MYLHLGQNVVIEKKNIIGIFDLDNATVSKRTREYLSRKENEKRVVTVGYDLPNSFIVCIEKGVEIVYISQISAATLAKRYYEHF